MKKILCLFGALTLLLTSCSSDDSGSSVVLLKKEITTDSDGDKVTTDYKYDGNKIISATVQGTTTGIYFTYTGDLITKMEFKYEGVVEQVNKYEYDSNGKLISFIRVEPLEENGSKEVYTYNSDGSISITAYSGTDLAQTTADGTGKITFVNGEIDKIALTYGPTRSYTYDDKNNPYKNVLGYDKISFTDGEAEGILHNIVSVKNGTKVTESYVFTYNGDGYPVKSVDTDGSGVATTEYFY
ncbi:hypothetical protein EYY60_11775 [Flavobacterium zhairuonense]|uniref:hypothetical protein n=1 Tax=Flavobacterium zhairuonense TaxID=2493631 RepID=UPI001052BC1E|nr:hypothetical protein [Flavobacterium zhairuonense]KAF2510182.1 hypothetical protein EYY60_11775 [Flavobacterium zhairuonense]